MLLEGKKLVITGVLNDDSIALKAVNEGAQDFLRKARVDSEVLPRAIRYAIERHRMLEQVRQLAIADELTGLVNRRGFMLLAGASGIVGLLLSSISHRGVELAARIAHQ